MKNLEKAYKEIFKVIDKYGSDLVFDIPSLKHGADMHVFGNDLVEKYGFRINPRSIKNTVYQELKSNVHLVFIDGEERKISWPDDDIQPHNETLIKFGYPTGPYFFDGDYPIEFFQRFFNELKSYGPKYTDSANKCLYFTLDNAGKIFNEYDSIVKKYYEENKKDRLAREIKRKREELKELESTQDNC